MSERRAQLGKEEKDSKWAGLGAQNLAYWRMGETAEQPACEVRGRRDWLLWGF